jgi:hypothetical protein
MVRTYRKNRWSASGFYVIPFAIRVALHAFGPWIEGRVFACRLLLLAHSLWGKPPMQRIKAHLVNRRTVVGSLLASGLLGVFSFAAVRKQEGSSGTTSTSSQTTTQTGLATSEMDKWSRRVGSDFTTGTFRLRLQGVRALNSSGDRPAELRDTAFLAVFEVLSGGYMPGDLIYRMTTRNEVLDVFLANAFTSQYPRNMHAVFN